MATDSDRDWRKWGRSEPYFGVVTEREFKADRIAANTERFFDTGRRDVATVMEQIARFYGDIPTARALDFGSGVGRLVLPFTERFDHVVGVDISEDMIAEARRNCANAAVQNVDFAMSDDELTAVAGSSFDLIHSYIVLQHVPIKRGLALTDRLLALLKPGGVAALHYSLQRKLSAARAVAYPIQHHVPFGRAVTNSVRGRSWDAPAMQMNNYPLAEIIGVFEQHGLDQIVVVPEQHDTALTAYVFGRKSGAVAMRPIRSTAHQ